MKKSLIISSLLILAIACQKDELQPPQVQKSLSSKDVYMGDNITNNNTRDSNNARVAPGAQMTFLKQGWDEFDNPLKKGKVIWNQPTAGIFQVTYILEGALANHIYQVGIHLFPNDDNYYWDDFGSEGWEDGPRDQELICRWDEGVEYCSQLNAWEFGFLTTDELGDGATHFNLHPKPGTYNIQFNVRIGLCNWDDHDGCPVVFESGGHFTTTETIVIYSRVVQ